MPTTVREHKRGKDHYMFGRKMSLETRKKMSEKLKGNSHTLGHTLSDEHKRKLSVSGKGKNTWAKGKPWSEARRKAQEFVVVRPRTKSLKIGKLEYHPDWVNIRKRIYQRDNWTCRECNIKCHGNGAKNKIQCHHIDFDTTNNTDKNLITLCAGCHAKTRLSREDWIKYYKLKMEILFNDNILSHEGTYCADAREKS